MLTSNVRNYRPIIITLFISFVVCSLFILVLNFSCISCFLNYLFGERQAFIFQLYFWAAMGATVASYKYLANDVETNVLESIKSEPDPAVLRYPNSLDVYLYIQRILFSGVEGVVGAIIVFAGLSYFEISAESITDKHKFFLEIFCFVVGMYESDFLGYLKQFTEKFFKKGTQKDVSKDG